MKSKVLLLVSPNDILIDMQEWNMPPLSVGSMQSFLKEKGLMIQSYDLNAQISKKIDQKLRQDWIAILNKEFVFRNLLEDNNFSEIQGLFGKFLDDLAIPEYDVVGISSGANSSIFEIHSAFLIGKLIKLKYKKTVVFGGLNISYLLAFRDIYAELWQIVLKKFNYLITGPGEETFMSLLEIMESVDVDLKFRRLPGAIYLNNGNLVSNPPALAKLSCPDFKGLDLDFYKSCTPKNEPEKNEVNFFKIPHPFPILQSRINRNILSKGQQEDILIIPYIFNYHCPYKCAFCEESEEHKSTPLSKEALPVFKDLKKLAEQYQTKYFYFINNIFNYKRSFVKELCQLIIDNHLEIYWSDCARFENLTKESLELMYRAGCRKLIFGVESASDKILKIINKKLNLEQAEQVLAWCHDVGIWADIEVIIGFPFELDEDFQATYNFINKNRKNINNFQLNKYFVLPDSLFGRLPQNYGIEIVVLENYDQILARNRAKFNDNFVKRMETTDMLIKSFNEINGRQSAQIVNETGKKYIRILNLLSNLSMYKKDLAHFLTGENSIFKLKNQFHE